ncbi:MAG: BREX system ATP-binding domain-containing protein, partial [Candidatus Xenobia bacterium]
IDENQFPGLHVLVTGTPDLFDSVHGVAGLEPLHARLKVEFAEGTPDNLRQPQIRLFPFDRERLLAVARRVRDLYPSKRLAERVTDDFMRHLADRMTRAFGGHVDVVPRFFLREFVNVLDLVDQHPDYQPMQVWELDAKAIKSFPGLRPEEENALALEVLI